MITILSIAILIYGISFFISIGLLLCNLYEDCNHPNDIIEILLGCMNMDYFIEGTILGKIVLIISWFCCLPWMLLWLVLGVFAMCLKYLLNGFAKLCGWIDKGD